MPQRQPKALLERIDKNLKTKDETDSIKKKLDETVKYVNENGFSEIISSLNLDRNTFGNGELFTEQDFDGAEIFPDEKFSEIYSAKHTLQPLSLGVLISKNNWYKLTPKLNISPSAGGHALNKEFFTHPESNLKQSGLVLHVNRDFPSDKEFENIFHGPNLYSKAFATGEKGDLESFRNPELTQVKFEYWLIKDLYSYAVVEELSGTDLNEYLQNRISVYVDTVVRSLGIPGKLYQDATDAYEGLTDTLRKRVPHAIDATIELKENIGTKLLTPFTFSLGSSLEEMELNHFLSPTLGLIYANDAIKQKTLSPSSIENRIKEKGYLL